MMMEVVGMVEVVEEIDVTEILNWIRPFMTMKSKIPIEMMEDHHFEIKDVEEEAVDEVEDAEEVVDNNAKDKNLNNMAHITH